MKEIFILFGTPMVKAIADGRKTQTRRVMKVQPPGDGWQIVTLCCSTAREDRKHIDKSHWARVDGLKILEQHPEYWSCPYGQPGDRLGVKESAWMWCERRPNGVTKTGRPKWHYVPLRAAPIHYAADHPLKPALQVVSPDTGNEWGWRFKVGRFLPRWAIRTWLTNTGVRVERLQEISDTECVREGLLPEQCTAAGGWKPAFAQLWQSINGPDSWDASPWVWVVEFKRVAS